MNIAFGYGTVGRASGENHDAFGAFDLGDHALLVVCDGQGGSSVASQAAATAIQTIHGVVSGSAVGQESADPSALLREALTAANRAIYEEARKNHRLMGMSASVVAALISREGTVIGHVGNCRAYLRRGPEVEPLTRDHTMVNTFIDNELLSPEDAASHPEAHVLSRALGTERQIDVEVQPFTLDEGDVLVLCSDGLHRAVDIVDLVPQDWSDPARSAQHPLRKVQMWGAADAATLVGARLGGSGGAGMGPTAVPVAESGGDQPTPQSRDEIRAPTLHDVPQPPALYPLDPVDEPTAASTDLTSDSGGLEQIQPHSPVGASLPPRVPTRTPPPPPPPNQATGQRRRLLLRIGVGVTTICVLLLAGAVILRNVLSSGLGDVVEQPVADLADNGPASQAAAVAGTTEPPATPPVAEPDPVADPHQDRSNLREVSIISEPHVFAHIRLPALRSNDRTPMRYTSAPPSAEPRVEIVRSIQRTQGCEEAERVIDRAMRRSSDYAPLFRDLWQCYRDLHDDHTAGVVSAALNFPSKRPHLEGSPEQPTPNAALPLWFLPATDGIERRMDLYHETATTPDRFHDVVNDTVDEDLLATRFHYDLMIQVAYARAHQPLPNPTSDQIQDWARRVYNARKHLDSRVGLLVQRYDPAADRRIRQVLQNATNDFEPLYRQRLSDWLAENPGGDKSRFDWRAVAAEAGLPAEVAEALLVAAKELPPPTGRAIKAAEEQPKVVRPRPPADPCKVSPTDPRCIP